MRFPIAVLACVAAMAVPWRAGASRDLFSDTWVATDALGRALPAAAACGPPRRDRTVGIFYFLWHGEHVRGGPFDVTQILAHTPDAMENPASPPWGPMHAFHHWGEPLLGYYRTDDAFVLRKHAQMLADAGVDVVIFDVTNQATYRRWCSELLRVWGAMRAEGNRTPQVAFLTPFGDPARVVEELYRDLYEPGIAPDLWFRWEGRPLILADPARLGPSASLGEGAAPQAIAPHGTLGAAFTADRPFDAAGGSFGTWRRADLALTLTLRRDGPRGEVVASGRFRGVADNDWTMLRLPRTSPPGAYYLEASAPTGTIAWWSKPDAGDAAVRAFAGGAPSPGSRRIRLEWSSDRTARIRRFFTFRAPQPDYFRGPTGPDMWSWLEVYPQHVFRNARGEKEQMTAGVAQNAVGGRLGSMSEPGARGRSYHAGAQDARPDAVMRGLNFAEQFDRVLKEDPRFVFVTGWNEWIAMRFDAFNGVNRPVMFVDAFDHEHSRDIEPVRGGHGDNYYYQMAAYIRRYKGVRRVQPVRSARIRVDGAFGDWARVSPEFRDTIGDPVRRAHPSWNPAVQLASATGRSDIVSARVSCGTAGVSFYVRTRTPIAAPNAPNWMTLLIDTDTCARTGWLGYDVAVNRLRAGSVERCVGGFHWRTVGQIAWRMAGCELELTIPWRMLGPGARPRTMDFKWTDNCLLTGDWTDFTLNGDAAPNDRFNYHAVFAPGK